MCLIVFAIGVHPRYPFILAGNRDEFYERPAKPAFIWDTKPEIIAGKDEKAGGTWLGVSAQGRFAALTNFRDMRQIKENAPSRGYIVRDILTSPKSVPDFLDKLKKTAPDYNGFNLIAGTTDSLYYFSSIRNEYHNIIPGIYSISNAFLGTSWPKTDRTEKAFKKIIQADTIENEELFNMLQYQKTYPNEKLPDTGLPDSLEKAVSAVFIKTENYGTRCSTLVMADRHSKINFEERSYTPGSDTVFHTARYNLTV